MPYEEWNRYLREFPHRSDDACDYPSDLYVPAARADSAPCWNDLTARHLERFDAQGFLVVERAFTPAQVKAAIAGAQELVEGRVTSYRPDKWGRKHGVKLLPQEAAPGASLDSVLLARALVEHHPALLEIAQHPLLLGALRTIMNDEPVLVHSMLRAKPRGDARDKPWHQDLTHFNLHPTTPPVSAWMALDEADVEDGCLFFLPGSHVGGPVKHVYLRDYQIPDEDVPREGQVAAPVPAGGCVLLNGMVLHGSPRNSRSGRRLALQLTFAPAHAKAVSDEERIMAFAGPSGGPSDGRGGRASSALERSRP